MPDENPSGNPSGISKNGNKCLGSSHNVNQTFIIFKFESYIITE